LGVNKKRSNEEGRGNAVEQIMEVKKEETKVTK
jgi:hypothetical protein